MEGFKGNERINLRSDLAEDKDEVKEEVKAATDVDPDVLDELGVTLEKKEPHLSEEE
mgnify:CR=1 FL=1